MHVVTITERKAREARRRQDAALRVIAALGAYAAAHRGRYLVFGSAARRAMTDRSDFDVLVDFPPEAEHDAFTYLEELCHDERLPLDALSRRTMSDRFMRRNGAGMVTVGV